MSAAGKYLRRAGSCRLSFWCPGCSGAHMVAVRTDARPAWTFNEDLERPTFSPSILVTYNGSDAGVDGAPPAICHSFVRDGQIEFCSDSTHALAGQTVPLPEWPEGA